jgi:hypothetical protein
MSEVYCKSWSMKMHMPVCHIVQEKSLDVALKSDPLVILPNQFLARLTLISLINKENLKTLLTETLAAMVTGEPHKGSFDRISA